ncbi:helix-turn-helix transcriptional regulator [Spirosoma fluviale]|uniref:Predicted DNA-binding transcriptional regulator YafY, contains an HTH and WYL domains n=1 Tax=Spirosoma fluviale TaxID=1597977 RepID=A0A286FZM5_9BACT|nr:WYL domain-containing protein [Spirosoma fluviale]SOD88389.1 Predicted DNA-binding transcriptional regulator YafY, contains an HTH and WYL domains [Spirosoma fluviale]
MAAQQNLTRTLKLIRLLKQRPGKTLGQLAQLLECSPRHARRFMDALEEAGFIIDSEGKRPPRFYLYEDERRQRANFTEEEAQLLQEALASIASINPLLAPLRQKIYQYSTLLPIANGLVDQHQSHVVAQLAEAIRDRRQVRLLRYHSINSNSISDRLVEPYSFSENFTRLTAFEPESNTVKTFKTQRIEDVLILDLAQENPPSEILTDPFDWPGEPRNVSVRLTYQAYHLLTEEFPVTRLDITPNPDDTTFQYRYEGTVNSWIGIGRFVLGLPGQVQVDGPEAFRAYLRGRVGEVSW